MKRAYLLRTKALERAYARARAEREARERSVLLLEDEAAFWDAQGRMITESAAA